MKQRRMRRKHGRIKIKIQKEDERKVNRENKYPREEQFEEVEYRER